MLDDDPVRAQAPDSLTRKHGSSTEEFRRFVASPASVASYRTRSRDNSLSSLTDNQSPHTAPVSSPAMGPSDPVSPRNSMPLIRMSFTPAQDVQATSPEKRAFF